MVASVSYFTPEKVAFPAVVVAEAAPLSVPPATVVQPESVNLLSVIAVV